MTVVVSSLIALMKDRVDALQANGAPAACIASGMTLDERRFVWDDIRNDTLKLLYVSPERSVQPTFLDFLQRTRVSFIAVDEAHCISQWGHDFCPEYRRLSVLRDTFPDLHLHAYTAAATPQVRDDIMRELRLRDPQLLVGSFDRPNLVYRVCRRTNRLAQVRDIADAHAGEPGLV